MERKKILHIGAKNYPPAHGGTERVVYNIVNSIADKEFYLLVEWEQKETDNVKVMPAKLNYFAKAKYILKFTRQNKLDIIHFHNEKYIPMAIGLLLFFRNIVLTVHGVHFRSPKFSLFNRLGFFFVDLLGVVMLPKMVFCSEYDKVAFRKFSLFRKTYYVNNGADVTNIKQSFKTIEKPDTYVYLGRLTPAKNILRLIDAAENSGIKVDLYGIFDKECEDYSRQIHKKLEVAKFVKYKGVVPFDKVLQTIIKYRAFIYVTIMEGLPLAVLEAASCNMYLILSEIPHHTYLRFPDVSYVNPKSIIIPKPEELFTVLNNREHMISHFSNKKMGMEYNKIYDSFFL